MKRIIRAALVSALAMMLPAGAWALGFEVVSVTSSNGPITAIENGSTVTVDLRLVNPTNEDVYGLGYGFDGIDPDANGLQDNGLSYSSSIVSATAFTVVDTGTALLGGIPNTTAPVAHGTNNPLFPQFNEEVRYTLFSGAQLSAANGDGSLDDGIDGNPVGTTGAHLRVVFTATAGAANFNNPNNMAINFGVIPQAGQAAVGTGGADLAFTNQIVNLTIVPEPGTALLMGLGLAGLAGAGRPRS